MRVVIAEDSVLLREGLARLLARRGFEVVGQAGDADELLLAVRRDAPDVAIVDVRMPPTHTDEGARAAREIRERHPEVGVLVLSQTSRPRTRCDSSPSGRSGFGYLLKDRVLESTTSSTRAARRPRRHGDRPRRGRAAPRPPRERRPARGADRRASAKCSA